MNMRWYILRTLVFKEFLRHLTNRGGIAMIFLLIVAAMLLSFFGRKQVQSGPLVGGVLRCYVDYRMSNPLIEHLRRNEPEELAARIVFRQLRHQQSAEIQDTRYPEGTGGIQIITQTESAAPHYQVLFRYKGSPADLAPFEAWFWAETRRYYQRRVQAALGRNGLAPQARIPQTDLSQASMWQYNEAHRWFREEVSTALAADPNVRSAVSIPTIQGSRKQLTGVSKHIELQTILASSLILFALFFSCVYLLPSMTCEERERGILLAQALSPASPAEILGAKFLFYPGLAMGLGAILGGLYQPKVLLMPFFWLALGVTSSGFLGIGLVISSLARTQRAASLGAMCYLLAVALLILICQLNMIPFVTNLSLENHTTLMMRHALADAVARWNYGNLAISAFLAVVWCSTAVYLFRKYGWQ